MRCTLFCIELNCITTPLFKDFRSSQIITTGNHLYMLKNIDEISAKTDISRNEFIIQCIDYAIKNMK